MGTLPLQLTLEFDFLAKIRFSRIEVGGVTSKPIERTVPKNPPAAYLAFAHCFVSYVQWDLGEGKKKKTNFHYDSNVFGPIVGSLAGALESPTWIRETFGDHPYEKDKKTGDPISMHKKFFRAITDPEKIHSCHKL